MRVLLVSTYSPLAVGGIGQFVHDFSIALHERGVEVVVVHRREAPEFALDETFGSAAEIVEISPRNTRGLRTISLNAMTRAWIRRRGRAFDVVHVLNPMPMSAAALRAAHGIGRPVVLTIYAKYPTSPSPVLRWINRRSQNLLLNESDVIVYESANTQHDFSPHSGRVILNGIDTGYFRPSSDIRARVRQRLGIGGREPVLLFLGRMDRMKGLYVFLEALSTMKRTLPEVRALLVGSVEVADLPQRIEALGLGNVAQIVGPVSKLDVLEYYCASDAFVLPSYLEGISSALIEAMACGLPAVATRVGGNVEVVRDGIEGILVPPGDASALASALGSVLDEDRRTNFGRNARDRIIERFSLDSMTEGYIEAYREVIGRYGSPSASA